MLNLTLNSISAGLVRKFLLGLGVKKVRSQLVAAQAEVGGAARNGGQTNRQQEEELSLRLVVDVLGRLGSSAVRREVDDVENQTNHEGNESNQEKNALSIHGDHFESVLLLSKKNFS
jgi:hypothetical protein